MLTALRTFFLLRKLFLIKTEFSLPTLRHLLILLVSIQLLVFTSLSRTFYPPCRLICCWLTNYTLVGGSSQSRVFFWEGSKNHSRRFLILGSFPGKSRAMIRMRWSVESRDEPNGLYWPLIGRFSNWLYSRQTTLVRSKFCEEFEFRPHFFEKFNNYGVWSTFLENFKNWLIMI